MRIVRTLALIVLMSGMTALAMAAEKRVLGTPIRLEGGIKLKELASGTTPPTGYGYLYFDTDGIAYSVNPAGTTVALGTTDTVWGHGSVATNIVTVTADDDILLADGGTLGWGDGNPGTLDTCLQRISGGILALDGAATAAGAIRFVEDSDNGSNYIGISPPQSVAANYTLILPATAPADKSIPYASATSTLATDATNFSWDDSTNANVLTLGAGTAAGTIKLLEGSGGGTSGVSITSPATLAGDIEYTMPDALPTTPLNFLTASTTGAITQKPAQTLLYASYAPAPTLDGLTGAETALTPASVEGTATIPVADQLVGAVFSFDAGANVTSDADGDETMTVKVYFGTHEVCSTGAIANDGPTVVVVRGTLKVKTVGAGGTAVVTGEICNGTTRVPFCTLVTNFDTTATHAFVIKGDHGGTTDANDTIILEDVNLWYCNFD